MALTVLILTFVAYVLRVAPPLVPLERLPDVWTLPVDRYVAATGAPTGWGWVEWLRSSDYANLLGVALLCLVTIGCYLRMLPILLRRGERLLAVVAIAQVVVLLAAASGWLAGAH